MLHWLYYLHVLNKIWFMKKQEPIVTHRIIPPSLERRKESMTEVADSAVQKTTEYDQFTLSNRNRPIDESKVAGWVRKIDAGTFYLEEFPGLVHIDEVKQEFVVMDAQHRFTACKRTGHPFFFRWQSANSKLTMDDIASVQVGTVWSAMDNIDSSILTAPERNRPSFILLKRVMLKYGISASTAIAILNAKPNGEAGGSPETAGMKNKTFYVSEKQEAAGWEFLEHAAEFRVLPERINKDVWKNKNFMVALQKYMRAPGYDKTHMSDRIEKYKAKFVRQHTESDYRRHLEFFYNHASRTAFLRFPDFIKST